jgi:hypothetical protein
MAVPALEKSTFLIKPCFLEEETIRAVKIALHSGGLGHEMKG